MAKKQKKVPKKHWPKLKSRSFLSGDWITNFWFLDKTLFFTDADLAFRNSILGTMPFDHLQENLKHNPNDLDRLFLAHPNPLRSSILGLSATDIELVQQYEGYVYNVNKIQEQLYVSIVSGSRGYVYANNQPIYQDLVIVGILDEEIVAKRTLDRKTVVIDPKKKNNFQTLEEDIKSIVNLKEKDVYLNDENQIIYNGDVIYESESDLAITRFDSHSLLVSEKATRTLFYLTGENLERKYDIWRGNYFFHLICLDKKIIIGKPLFDSEGMINYGLPPIFIY